MILLYWCRYPVFFDIIYPLLLWGSDDANNCWMKIYNSSTTVFKLFFNFLNSSSSLHRLLFSKSIFKLKSVLLSQYIKINYQLSEQWGNTMMRKSPANSQTLIGWWWNFLEWWKKTKARTLLPIWRGCDVYYLSRVFMENVQSLIWIRASQIIWCFIFNGVWQEGSKRDLRRNFWKLNNGAQGGRAEYRNLVY